MANQFFTILTAIGRNKLASATATGMPITLTQMAVGDGDAGAYYNPTESQTALKHEVWRGQINNLFVDPGNPNWIVVELLIPDDVGGFYIREVGLFDNSGEMIAVGKFPESYKPIPSAGASKQLSVRMILEVTNVSAVTLTIDPNIVVATRQDVDAHASAVNPHPQYLTEPEGSAMISAAVAALVNGSPAMLDTLNELAAALGNDANFATTMANALAAKANLSGAAFSGLVSSRVDQAGYTYFKVENQNDTSTNTVGVKLTTKNGDWDLKAIRSGGFSISTPTTADAIFAKNDGKTGFGTTNPLVRLHVAGDASFADRIFYSNSYAVTPATYVPITLYGTQTALQNGYGYRITLATINTGNSNGAVYLIRQTAVGAWAAQRVSAESESGPAPMLRVNGSAVEVYHNHASGTYTILANVETLYKGNTNLHGFHAFGLEGVLQAVAGYIGQGVSPSASWWASMRAYELGRAGNGIFGATGDDEINIGANVINTGSGTYVYGAADTASLYRQVSGQHVFYRAAAGAAGAAMTLAESGRFDASGQFGVGTAAPAATIDARTTTGAIVIAGRTSNAGANSQVGTFAMHAPNAGGTSRVWGQIRSVVTNAAAGTEASQLILSNQKAGAFVDSLTIQDTGRVDMAYGARVAGPADLAPTGTPGIVSYEYPVLRHYIGDGTGYSWALTKRAAGANTDLVTVTDNGNVSLGYGSGNRIAIGTDQSIASTKTDLSSYTPLYLDGSKVSIRTGAGTVSEKAVFDANGHFGLSVTPKSNWASGSKAVQLADSSSVVGDVNSSYVSTNAYWTASGSFRIKSNYALQYYQDGVSGKHGWRVAGTGLADSAITWTEAMTLDSSGNLIQGPGANSTGTNPARYFRQDCYSTSDQGRILLNHNAGGYAAIGTNGNGGIWIGTAGANDGTGVSKALSFDGGGNAAFAAGLTANGGYKVWDKSNDDRIGQVAFFACTTAPAGWMKANGAAVSIASYPELAARIYCGDANNATAAWGYKCTNPANPNGSRSTAGTYIVLPDLRGEGLRGWDDGRGVDSGRSLYAWQDQSYQAHNHGVSDPGHAHNISDPGHTHNAFVDTSIGPSSMVSGSLVTGVSRYNATDGGGKPYAILSSTTGIGIYSAYTGISTNNSGGVETRMRNIALLGCIKYA